MRAVTESGPSRHDVGNGSWGIAPLPVQRVGALDQHTDIRHSWLVDQLWALDAVGLIGGGPKVGKTWLGLDLAISVSSGTPALDLFAVEHPGPALVYLAEDSLPAIRARVAGICAHRSIDFQSLPLHIVTVPGLRLDCAADRARLDHAVAELQPRLLLLDPLVRLHRADENRSADIAELLGRRRRRSLAPWRKPKTSANMRGSWRSITLASDRWSG